MKNNSVNPASLQADRIKQVRSIYSILLKKFPAHRKIALVFSNPLELLVSTILSAQCTDERVNKITPGLFQKYPSASSFAHADQKELEKDIFSAGFYHSKAKAIIAACDQIVSRFNGTVPSTMDELTSLSGIGRKSANVILGQAFGISSGIVVDTHMKRVANRLGLTTNTDPDKIEKDLMTIVDQKYWIDFSSLIVWHGRLICIARKPKCPECPIAEVCPSSEV